MFFKKRFSIFKKTTFSCNHEYWKIGLLRQNIVATKLVNALRPLKSGPAHNIAEQYGQFDSIDDFPWQRTLSLIVNYELMDISHSIGMF